MAFLHRPRRGCGALGGRRGPVAVLPALAEVPAGVGLSRFDDRLSKVEGQMAGMRQQITVLEDTLKAVQEQLGADILEVKEALGELIGGQEALRAAPEKRACMVREAEARERSCPEGSP